MISALLRQQVRLSEIIGENVRLLSDCVGPEIEAADPANVQRVGRPA